MQLPFQPVSQATQASAARETEAGHAGRTAGGWAYDSGTLMHQGPWETLFLTIEVLANSKTSMAECIVPPLVGAAVAGRDRTCLSLCTGLGWALRALCSTPQHLTPNLLSPLKSSNRERV